VGQFRILIGMGVAVCALTADTPLDNLLRAVEARYNKAKTLQVSFKEEYTPPGHSRRTENGILMLRRPGKMRWDYSQPAGKQVVADGKNFWVYTPSENRVEKVKFQESEDMRAPLAFLLGKLHFDKEFRNIQSHPEGDGLRITAEPKSDSLPYSAVEFVVAPDNHIREVKVTGFDKSVLRFVFDQERVDPALDNKLFQFQMPKGAELVDAGQH
jgi:outer membrane lipoprotein carrier protein